MQVYIIRVEFVSQSLFAVVGQLQRVRRCHHRCRKRVSVVGTERHPEIGD